MSKTPFEIRSDLIQLATDHLTKQYTANCQFAAMMLDKALQGVQAPTTPFTTEQLLAWQQSLNDQMKAFMPTVPTMEQIVTEASKLYSFVSKKD